MTRTRRIVLGGFALVAIAGTILLACSPRLRHLVAEDGPACLFRQMTGLPCPYCGMTHACIGALAGDVAGAFAAHPLWPLVIAVHLWASVHVLSNARTRGKALFVVSVAATTASWIGKLVT